MTKQLVNEDETEVVGERLVTTKIAETNVVTFNYRIPAKATEQYQQKNEHSG